MISFSIFVVRLDNIYIYSKIKTKYIISEAEAEAKAETTVAAHFHFIYFSLFILFSNYCSQLPVNYYF